MCRKIAGDRPLYIPKTPSLRAIWRAILIVDAGQADCIDSPWSWRRVLRRSIGNVVVSATIAETDVTAIFLTLRSPASIFRRYQIWHCFGLPCCVTTVFFWVDLGFGLQICYGFHSGPSISYTSPHAIYYIQIIKV